MMLPIPNLATGESPSLGRPPQHPTPQIAFVCIGNCCRSQLAEGIARSIAGDRVQVFSAGSRPAGFVSPDAIAVLAEIGIDISKNRSKGLDQLPQGKFDAIVTMGCGDVCPQVPAHKRFDWKIPDPIGQPLETFREVRDLIQTRIHALFTELQFIPSSSSSLPRV